MVWRCLHDPKFKSFGKSASHANAISSDRGRLVVALHYIVFQVIIF